MSLFETLEAKARLKRRRIGISILNWNESIRSSLERAKSVAEIFVYGSPQFGFEGVKDNNQEAVGRQMVRDLKSGKIDQFVRGQVDDFGTVDEFKKLFNIPIGAKRILPCMMQDAYRREFWCLLVSNPEGQSFAEKIWYLNEATHWFKQTFSQFVPKIGIMATCRPGSVGRNPAMTKSFEEAEAVVKHLTGEGINARNFHIELENAIQWANVILPSNGTIGNQIFRTLVYLGNGRLLASPTIFPNYGIYEDDSRNEQDWYPHIVAAVAYANQAKS